MYGLLDPQSKQRHGADGPTAWDSMGAAGMRLFEAFKSRKAGIEQMIERLNLDAFGQPKLFMFEGRCPNLLRSLQTIGPKKSDADDYDGDDDYNSHACDALRYLLVDWPVGTTPDNNKGDEDVTRWMALAKKRDAIHGRESTTGYGD